MYDTGTQSQCSVKTWRDGVRREMGGEFKGVRTHIYLWLIHVDVHGKNHYNTVK